MKRLWQRCLACLLVLAFSVGISPGVFAEDYYTVRLDVQYGQTEARAMLDLINELRTGDNAWQWNEDNTQKVYLETDLSALQYDYYAEQLAMQRAAELVLYYSHTRPDGSRCFTVWGEGSGIWAENIAIGYTSAEAVFEAWQEEEELYEGQGHRRNMLGGYNVVGIGHAEYNGVECWVQEFALVQQPDTDATTANDSTSTVEIRISGDQITSAELTADPSELVMETGAVQQLPTLDVRLVMEETFSAGNGIRVEPEVQWSVDNPSVAQITNGQIQAMAPGDAVLTGSALGRSVSCTVHVGAVSLANAQVQPEQTAYPYTGAEICPAVTVTLNGRTLQEGTDYTLHYTNNIQIGMAQISVTGTGGYTGTVSCEFEILPCVHVWNSGQITTPPTCTQPGVKTLTCTICGEQQTEELAVLPHTEVQDPAVAATCTSTGLTAGSHCSVCGTVILAQQEIPIQPHSEQETVIQPATCTADGEKEIVCTVCGLSRTERIPATGHNMDGGTVLHPPTCTQAGQILYRCQTCGSTQTQQIPATGHSWAAQATVDRAPTCTEAGEQSIHCTVCQERKDIQQLPAAGHQWGAAQQILAPTCTAEGKNQVVCQVCQATQEQAVPALGHDWDEGRVETPASCSLPGSKVFQCRRCGETKTESVPATGHTYRTEHIAPTCASPGYTVYTCTVCNYQYKMKDQEPLSHTLVTQGTKPATCTQPGYTGNQVCTVCGQTVQTGQAIPATGHRFSTTWSSNTDGHWQTCACGARTASAAHSYRWITDKAATATQPGSQHQECSVCGFKGLTASIPATGTSSTGQKATPAPTATPAPAAPVPQTGDTAPVTLWVVLLGVSGCAILVAVILSIRRRRR